MIHKETDPFYRSAQWERMRQRVLRRDGYVCQYMKRYGRMVQADTVHHVIPREEHPELALCEWNLISLCATAHDRMHDRRGDRLSAEGMELVRRVCRRYSKEIPEAYR